jgi:hypothetical protein
MLLSTTYARDDAIISTNEKLLQKPGKREATKYFRSGVKGSNAPLIADGVARGTPLA